MKKAKIFINGKSQAVRLPMEFRFKCNEVSVTKMGNALVLQPIADSWAMLFKNIKSISGEDETFLKNRNDSITQKRNFFK